MLIQKVILWSIGLLNNTWHPTNPLKSEYIINEIWKDFNDTYKVSKEDFILEDYEDLSNLNNDIKIQENPTRTTLLKIKTEDQLNDFLKNLNKESYKDFIKNYSKPQINYINAIKTREELIKERKNNKSKLERTYNSKENYDNKTFQLGTLKEEYNNIIERINKNNEYINTLSTNWEISYASYIEQILFGQWPKPQKMTLENAILYTRNRNHILVTNNWIKYKKIVRN